MCWSVVVMPTSQAASQLAVHGPFTSRESAFAFANHLLIGYKSYGFNNDMEKVHAIPEILIVEMQGGIFHVRMILTKEMPVHSRFIIGKSNTEETKNMHISLGTGNW